MVKKINVLCLNCQEKIIPDNLTGGFHCKCGIEYSVADIFIIKLISELKEQNDLRTHETTVLSEKYLNLEDVLRELKKTMKDFVDFHWTLESEGQTHERDLTFEEKYEKHAEFNKRLSDATDLKTGEKVG